MMPLVEVAVLVGAATLLADEWAHRDELAARRFRELNPETVASELDISRNKRWHRVGFRQRLETMTLAAGLVLAATQSWLAFAVSWVLLASVVSLVFDISFNIRLRLPWWYAGTTAWTDEWLNAHGLGNWEGGKVAATLEALLILASASAWMILF